MSKSKDRPWHGHSAPVYNANPPSLLKKGVLTLDLNVPAVEHIVGRLQEIIDSDPTGDAKQDDTTLDKRIVNDLQNWLTRAQINYDRKYNKSSTTNPTNAVVDIPNPETPVVSV